MHDLSRPPAHRVGSAIALALLSAGLLVGGAGAAAADPVQKGSASAFGGVINVNGEPVAGPEPVAMVDTVPGDQEATTIDIPAEPVAVSGTLTAIANLHEASDIESGLTVVEQEAVGPYNVRGLGQIEGAQVLIDAAGEGVPLLNAALIRAEAVGVCAAGAVSYSANSEIVDLDIGGEDIPLNAPIQDIIDGLNGVLAETGLSEVVSVERNVVTELEGGGIAVDALVVTVLAAAGDVPLAQVVLGHAEVGPLECAAPKTQCTDGLDNDGDGGRIDIDDPGCHTDGTLDANTFDPADDDESDPQCSNNVDDADPEDTVLDIDDPGCHRDGDASNPATFEPLDDDETDLARAGVLPKTGGTPAGALGGAALLAAALGGLALRRRATS